tara:strand:- start:60363 stop:63251 length:2889 start_codon:yes stop_codon:yes gene_type:complete
MSYMGRSLRNRFPLWSETRRNESSNSAMLLDAIGESIDEERYSFLQTKVAQYSLTGNATPEFGHFFKFEPLKLDEYLNYVKESSLFENLRCTAIMNGQEVFLAPKYSYRDMILSAPTRQSSHFLKKENVRLLSVVEDENILLNTDSHFHFQNRATNMNMKYTFNGMFDFKNDYKKIYIKIENSSLYNSIRDDENFNNHYSIILRGKDEADYEVEEIIEVKDDGTYVSKTWFKSLEPLIENNEHRGGGSVETYGFNGDIKFYTAPIETFSQINNSSLIVKISNEIGFNTLSENNIEYDLTHNTINQKEVSFLEYSFRSYESGTDYKQSAAEMDPSDFKETLSKRAIVNENLDPIKIESFAIDKNRNKILTIDKSFKLREYNAAREAFKRKRISRTQSIDFAFEAENQRIFLNETIKLNLLLERAKGGIQSVFIGRHTPERRLSYVEDSDFNFEFLQEDMSWNDNFYYFSSKLSDDSYQEFNSMEFLCDHSELGQYDYYVFTLKNYIADESYLNKVKTGVIPENEFKALLEEKRREFNQKDLLINNYSVLCEEMSPEFFIQLDETGILNEIKVLEGIELGGIPSLPIHGSDTSDIPEATNFIDAEDYSLAIWFENTENDLYLSINHEDKNYIFKIKRFYDYIFYDYLSGHGISIEDYDQLNIVVNEAYDFRIFGANSEEPNRLIKTRNSTWIDEIGFRYGVSREVNESLNDYRHRIYKVVKGTLKREKDSFYKSLGYITAMSDVNIFRITKVNSEDDIEINITSNRIHIKVDGALVYENRFENLKFLIDVFNLFDGLNYLDIETLEEGDAWWYKRSSNLMPASTKRQKINLAINTQSKKLPDENVFAIKDLNGDFLNSVSEEQIVSPYNYSLENNVLHKYKLAEESVTYTYQKFPLDLKWLPIKACSVTDVNFEDIIKTTIYDNENYGTLTGLEEEKETERLLSQDGSVIVNQILSKQNTYWGK